MKAGPQADQFGEFLVRTLRDEAIDFFDRLAAGGLKSKRTKALRDALAGMTPGDRDAARRTLMAALDHGLHSFLFALGEEPESGVAVTVGGSGVAGQSDGLHGELTGDGGWLRKFSRHGPGPE